MQGDLQLVNLFNFHNFLKFTCKSTECILLISSKLNHRERQMNEGSVSFCVVVSSGRCSFCFVEPKKQPGNFHLRCNEVKQARLSRLSARC